MRIGIITDIHEDVISLKKSLMIFENQSCDELICLGDIVGFDPNYHTHSDSRNASECIHIIKQNCKYIVAGNHDIYALDRHQLEFDDKSKVVNYDKLSHNSNYDNLNYNDLPVRNFSVKDYEFIESLDTSLVVGFGGFIVSISHSVFPDLTGKSLIRQDNPWEFKSHFDYIKKNHCDFSIGGHLHPSGLIKSNNEEIQLLNFGVYNFDTNLCHYSFPNLVSTNGKSGIGIIDFNNFSIEAFQINNSFNYWKKMNGWLRNR